jgi:uncharacterized NAD-dependent epimerase/dehydratase family protein
LTNPEIRCIGIAVNTAALDPAAGRALTSALAAEHGLPAADPIRDGVGAIVDELVRRDPV